jgi:thymidylate synthase (FAD)
MDPLFRVKILASTEHPERAAWYGMHQDYFEGFVGDIPEREVPGPMEAGRILVKHLLKGEKGHFGPLEHSQIVFGVGYFPHSVMVQARTHRVGVSFDVQSMRYTGARIVKFVEEGQERDIPWVLDNIEPLFYVRPTGKYSDRQGKKYEYTEDQRREDLLHCWYTAIQYARKIERGAAEEDARGVLASDYRQHFVVSFTLRALMHFLDLRAKKDAQLEIQQLCELILPRFEIWTPSIAAWYKENRWGKARLAP